MQSDRLTVLSSAFRAVPLTCGPHTLRPITAGTVLLLMDTGNPLFTESPDGASPAEQNDLEGLFQFLYIHIAPADEVLESCDDTALLRRRSRALGLTISFDDLASFSSQFAGIQQRLNAAVTEVVADPGAPGKPAAPPAPTGLPAWCIPSADAETRTASNGYFGGSPSNGHSNTCTPPTIQTETAPAGRSRIWEPEQDPTPEDLPENTIPMP